MEALAYYYIKLPDAVSNVMQGGRKKVYRSGFADTIKANVAEWLWAIIGCKELAKRALWF